MASSISNACACCAGTGLRPARRDTRAVTRAAASPDGARESPRPRRPDLRETITARALYEIARHRDPTAPFEVR